MQEVAINVDTMTEAVTGIEEAITGIEIDVDNIDSTLSDMAEVLVWHTYISRWVDPVRSSAHPL